MPSTAHDPPIAPGENPEVQPNLSALNGRGFEKYMMIKDRLDGVEPIHMIRLMHTGGYRWKAKRGQPGVLVKRRRQPVPDHMSFRQIAPELQSLTGMTISYETVRRWWEAAYGDADPGPVPGAVPESPKTPPMRRTVKRRATSVPTGDPHAQEIRVATAKAKARATNPDVPVAAFLPPAD